jgi:hypothetical protein
MFAVMNIRRGCHNGDEFHVEFSRYSHRILISYVPRVQRRSRRKMWMPLAHFITFTISGAYDLACRCLMISFIMNGLPETVRRTRYLSIPLLFADDV